MTPEIYGMQPEAMMHEISNHAALAFDVDVEISVAEEKAYIALFYVVYWKFIL